jgi:LPXTG-motif cell wall-anchored protein
VGTTTTGADGTYLFDDLPVLTAGEAYTVRVVRDDPSTVTALEPYVPTSAGVGDRAGDSSTWEASSEGLTTGGEHDPTLDFGFVVKTYAIGDYVWIDRDRDGTQDAGEAVLPGVTVELLVRDAGGVLVPATDVTGAPVPAQVTDPEGRYLFDALPAGTYQVRFTLTEEQSAELRFTTPDAAGDAVSSDAVVDADPRVGLTREVVLDDANPALSTAYDRPLAATQGVDPTWDAGVVRRSVRVGDLVWVDSNRDGRQDPGEPGIPGVVLAITGPDGGPVTDVHGDPVGTATTDADGRYLFADLPVLGAGESYTVRIVRDAPSTVEALRPYTPTAAGAGDRAGDSSPWSAASEGLAADGEEDLTLDFGFVLLDPVPAPADPGARGTLPVTGADSGPAAVAAIVLILLGGLFVALRRRRV